MRLALFDFDGTVTSKDSMFDFVKYSVGNTKFILGMTLLAPSMVAFKLGLINNTKAKELLLSQFFKGWGISTFEKKASDYARTKLPLIVKQSALDKINWHKEQGHKVVIVSASVKHWLEYWCNSSAIELLCTEIEVKHEKITGKLLTKNCHGDEKVCRIKAKFNLEDFNYIYAYGDSLGDKEMLALANESYYRVFK